MRINLNMKQSKQHFVIIEMYRAPSHRGETWVGVHRLHKKEYTMMFVCPVCGFVEEFVGEELPEGFKCPQCGVSGDRFIKQSETEMTWAAEHIVGVGKLPEVSEDIVNDLRANFEGECSEVGMYLAMARVAHREGYPEIGLYWEKAAYEEAEHAAKFAELLGEVVLDTKTIVKSCLEAE